MKYITYIVFALLIISGCATARRQFVPQTTSTTVGMQQSAVVQPNGVPTYQRGYGPQTALPYGYDGMQVPPATFVSEYAGSTYDPRTHIAVIQAEMAREQARRSGTVSAPSLPGNGCVNCVSRQDLGAVMDEVDALREEVDGR